jgi:hypothetical protein
MFTTFISRPHVRNTAHIRNTAHVRNTQYATFAHAPRTFATRNTAHGNTAHVRNTAHIHNPTYAIARTPHNPRNYTTHSHGSLTKTAPGIKCRVSHPESAELVEVGQNARRPPATSPAVATSYTRPILDNVVVRASVAALSGRTLARAITCNQYAPSMPPS